ncbi:MAG: hypothetical protein U0235_29205 [Polyangiaceae bacterium]
MTARRTVVDPSRCSIVPGGSVPSMSRPTAWTVTNDLPTSAAVSGPPASVTGVTPVSGCASSISATNLYSLDLVTAIHLDGVPRSFASAK